MSNHDHIVEDFEAYEPSWSYFPEFDPRQDQEQKVHKTSEPGSLFYNIDSLSIKNDQNIEQNQVQMEAQNRQSGKKRVKKIIEVNQKGRQIYLKAKIGQSARTNDLSTHTTSLIKASVAEYKTFFCLSEDHPHFLDEFKKNKNNLSTLRKLFSEAKQPYEHYTRESASSAEDPRATKTDELTIPFLKFLVDHFESGEMVTRILRNRKMSFGKKRMLIQYLGAIRRSFDCPQSLKSLKKLLS